MAGMFDGLVEGWKDRGQSLWDIAEQVNRGERSYAELALAGASNSTGAIFDVPAAAIGALVPDSIKEGFSDIMQQVYDTEAAKAASYWMKENPRATQNILNAVELAGNLSGAKVVGSGKLTADAALQSPSKLPGFYGSGTGGQFLSMFKAGLTKTLPNVARTYLSPTQAAMHREGLPIPLQRQTKQVSSDSFWNKKEKLAQQIKALEIEKAELPKGSREAAKITAAIDKKREKVKQMNSEVSFVEGQAEQTKLLNQSGGRESTGLLADFEKAQGVRAGAFTPASVYRNLTESEKLKNAGIVPDMEMAEMLHGRVTKAWEIDKSKLDNTETFIRRDNIFSNISVANKKAARDTRSSKTATLLRGAGELWTKYNPSPDVGTISFNSVEDLKTFAALTQLGDKTLMRKGNKAKGIESRPANKAERIFYKATESKRFAPRHDNSAVVQKMDQYLRYTDELKKGGRLTKAQAAAYDNILADMEKIKANMDVDSAGRVYLSGSHSSAVKALGGVNDQFVGDLRGNIVNMVTDENDLGNIPLFFIGGKAGLPKKLSLRVPGDKRMITQVEPNVYNVFGLDEKTKKLADQRQAKDTFVSSLEEKGTPVRSKTREGMLRQFSEAVEKRKKEIKPTAKDYGRVATGYGLLGGVASRQIEDPEQQ